MSERTCVMCGSNLGALVNTVLRERMCWECVDKAVEQALQVEAGNAVLIRKINGKWPAIEIGMDGETKMWVEDGIAKFDTPQEAMKEWEEKK